MSHDSQQREHRSSPLPLEEQSIDTVPRAAAFASVYNRMLELADDYLTEPVTATVKTYEDGTFRITVYHHRPGCEEREVLYFHTERSDGAIRYGIETDDELLSDRVVETVEPEMGSE